ncbi:hypothetical protein BC629DRAFT_1721140 [Irpex lacteus]|nr:hypothetical protein BC629DRAFT_1721140 [Irpex lacteus]
MAPIPPASSASGVMPALLASPWFKWSLLVVLAILLVSLGALTLVWIYGKATKSISTFIERVHERKLVLPTHLNPRKCRPIVLPLPSRLASTTQTVNAESLAVKNDITGTTLISEQFSLSLWLSTSLDHIALDECLAREESIDEADLEVCGTPALSSSLDTDSDSDDSSLQTPPLENTPLPVSLLTKKPAVVYDNYGSTVDILGTLSPTVAFTGFLCYADLNGCNSGDKACDTLDSRISEGPLYGNDIPTITISEDLEDTCSRYSYESPTLPSTPSTAALYTLGLPTIAHECSQAPSTSPISPIPIPFSPTLSPDSYIYVPPPGSADYFLSFEASSVQEDEPGSNEEQLHDLSRLTSGSRNAIFDDSGSFDWNRLLAHQAELDRGQVGSGLRSTFSTDSDLASEDVEDDAEADEYVTAQVGVQRAFDWDRLGGEVCQQEEDSGLRSAFSTDSDLMSEDDEDEDEDNPDSDEAPPSNMSRLGPRSTSGNIDMASDDIGTHNWNQLRGEVVQQREDSGLRSAFSTDSDLVYEDEDDEDEGEDDSVGEDNDDEEEE